MPTKPAHTRAQTNFLRLLAANPLGLQPEQWPKPTILRRWLRNDHFRHALTELRDAYRYAADLHLAGASVAASLHLQSRLADPDAGRAEPTLALLHTLRLSHTRERFQPKPPEERFKYPDVPDHLLDELEQLQRKTLRTHFPTALAEIGLPLPPDPRDLPTPAPSDVGSASADHFTVSPNATSSGVVSFADHVPPNTDANPAPSEADLPPTAIP